MHVVTKTERHVDVLVQSIKLCFDYWIRLENFTWFVINTLRLRRDDHHFADDIFKYMFLNENVWISLKYHRSLFLRAQLTIFQHWSAPWHYLNQCWLIHCHIYASLGLNELTCTIILATGGEIFTGLSVNGRLLYFLFILLFIYD